MQIVDRKIYSRYYNGPSFASNLADFNTNLAGNVMELKKAVYTINVDVQSNAQQGLLFGNDQSTNTIDRVAGDFIEDGFRIGDGFVASYNVPGGTNTFTGKITSINTTEFTYTVLTGVNTSTSTQAFNISLTTPLEGFRMGYNMMENNDPANYNSRLDGVTEQGFYADGVGFDTGGSVRSTAFVDCDFIGYNINKSWNFGSARVRFVQNLSNGTGNYVQQFEVEHTFYIYPYYLDGQLTNLQTITLPSDFQGGNSLKYITRFDFRDVLTNPNSSKVIEDDNYLGSTGWFNEAFNGLNSPFTIQNVSYEDASFVTVPKIKVGEDITVKFRVNSTDSSFSTSTDLAFYCSYLPSITEYQNQSDTFANNFLFDSKIGVADGAGIIDPSPFVIKSTKFTFVDANNIDCEIKVNFTDSRLDDTSNYLLTCEVASDGGSNTSSDRTNLIVDVETFEYNNDIPNLFDVDRLEFEEYNDPKDTNDFTDYKGWVEDTINVDFNFWLDLSLNAYLNNLKGRIVAYNPTTTDTFDLEEINFDLSSNVVVSGVQQINLDTARGFNDPSKNDYNIIKLVNGSLVGTKQYYEGELSIKLDWQNWLSLPSADTIFYDASKPNNGLNENASNYSLKNGYEIRFFIDADIEETLSGIVTNYIKSSPTIETYDYDLDDNGTPIYSGTIETFDTLGTSLGTTLLNSQQTVIKSTWNTTGTLYFPSSYDVTISLEPINASSKNAIKINDATVTVVGTDIIAEYTLNPSEIVAGVNYKISSRLYYTEPVITDILITGTPISVYAQDTGGVISLVNHDGSISIGGTNPNTPPSPTGDLTVEVFNGSGNVGDTVAIPVDVYNFIDMLELTFSIQYNDSLLSLSSITNGFFTGINVTDLGAGDISVTWVDGTGAGVTLPSATNLFILNFTIL